MKLDWQDSIYSDGSKNYLSNPTPKLGEEISVKLRVLKTAPVEKVFLRYIKNGNEIVLPMKKVEQKNNFNYYGSDFKITQKFINYHFYICTKKDTYYYNQLEVTKTPPIEEYDFKIVADYQVPQWVKSAVFYQIFPDRFYNGNPDNDVEDGQYTFDGHPTVKKDWSEKPGEYHETYCLDFFGGDLEGVRDKISYIKQLGANALYLNPIFYAATHHKYDCLDYFNVDPHFGGNQALAKLSEKLHQNEMKLMLDTSINHTGTAHKWFNKDGEFFSKDKGAYNNPEAKEREYYFFSEDNEYHAWAGVETLPTLNYTSKSLREIIYQDQDSVLKKWLKPPYNIDAWRLDVANTMGRKDEVQLHRKIWPEIRESIKEEKQDAYILGEHWTDDSEFLQGDEWDSAMNYFGFGRAIRQFLGENDHFLAEYEDYDFPYQKKKAKQVKRMFKQKLAKLPHQIAYIQFNLFDSHDIHRLHNNPEVDFESYRGAVMMLFAFPGAPNIYYGDEVGLAGHMESVEGCRYPMVWDEAKQDSDYYKLYQKLAHLKQNEAALQDGGFKVLYDKGYILSLARFSDQKAYVVISSQEEQEKEIKLPLGLLGVDQDSTITEFFERKLEFKLKEGILKLKLKAKESLLLEIEI